MAQIEQSPDQGMMVEDHLFYLPATMTERWNYTEHRLGTVTATYDDYPDFTWQITPSDSELISLSDIRLELEVPSPVQTGHHCRQKIASLQSTISCTAYFNPFLLSWAVDLSPTALISTF